VKRLPSNNLPQLLKPLQPAQPVQPSEAQADVVLDQTAARGNVLRPLAALLISLAKKQRESDELTE
jgi:hypothetical protein